MTRPPEHDSDAEAPDAETRLDPSRSDAAEAASDVGARLLSPGGAVDRDALFALYEEQAERDDETPVRVSFTLLKDLDKRLDKYLVDRVPFLSRTQIQRLIDEREVTVNGRLPKASTKLHKGDVVVATLPPPPSGAIQPEEIDLDVLYEDDDIIVLNKQPGLIVHPARAHKSGTLVNGLAWRFKHVSGGQLSSVGEEFARPGVVHRLDKWTSGAIVAAKNDTAHWRLGKQFEHRRTDKRYLAIVHGTVERETELVDAPLGKHPSIREKYAVRWDDTGKPSRTIWRVRERYETETGPFTLLELELLTGRTHQIRVHLSHSRHPIAGDDMYGGRRLVARDFGGDDEAPIMMRQALHATTLAFRHPMSEEPMRFVAPLAEDLRVFVRLLRRHRTATVAPAGSTIEVDALMT
jgi:23S rRNA pseudouridine1911/1915/1917 synthase